MSGVKISDECLTEYEKLKKNKKKWVIYKMNDKRNLIVPDHENSRDYKKVQDPTDFEEFNALITGDICRYAVYHCVMTLTDKGGVKSERDRLVFVSWAPDSAKVKDKMLHSSSKDALKTALVGIGIEFQFSTEQEKEPHEWIEKFNDLPNIKMTGDVTHFEG